MLHQDAIMNDIKHLRVFELSQICTQFGLRKGRKAEMQQRICSFFIAFPDKQCLLAPALANCSRPIPTAKSLTVVYPPPTTTHSLNPTPKIPSQSPMDHLKIPSSPFFKLKERICHPRILDNRHSQPFRLDFSLTADQFQLLKNPMVNGIKHRIYLLICGVESLSLSFTTDKPAEIAYPRSLTVSINEKMVQLTNAIGSFKKPWAVKPLDVTDLLIKDRNVVSIRFQPLHENRKFLAFLSMVDSFLVSHLVENIPGEMIRSREKVLNMDYRHQDAYSDDLVVSTGNILPLNDPLSLARIRIPVRSTDCKHVQCFEYETVLELHRDMFKFTCPICNQVRDFSTLVVDK
jgi:E3 SUMO-protein ligase PIAS1